MPPVTGRFASVSRIISRTTTSRVTSESAWEFMVNARGRGASNLVSTLRQVSGRGTRFEFEETTTTELSAETALALKVRAT